MTPFFRNVVKNTRPILVHHPGVGRRPTHPVWEELNDCRPPADDPPADTTVAVWSNFGGDSLLQRQYRSLGTPAVELGEGRPWHGWMSKLEWLADLNTNDRFLLCTDAADVKVVGPLADLPRKFLRERRRGGGRLRALFGGEICQWPQDPDRRHVWGALNPAPWNSLNAGVVFGEAEFLVRLARRTLERPPEEPHPFDDQYRLQSEMLANFREIGVDHRCELFQMVYGTFKRLERFEVVRPPAS